MTLEASQIVVDRGRHTILHDVSVVVARGRVTAIVGPNGAGKSTLLRTLGGEFQAKVGTVTLDGKAVEDYSLSALAKARSVMAQSASVVFDFTVAEILELGWVQSETRTTEQYEEAVRLVVSQANIEHLLARVFNTLSGGEQQRVRFARCMLQIWQPTDETETRYLLLDEPTSSLDLAHQLELMRLARRMSRRSTGIGVVLHDLNLAARFCDEIAIMHDGRIAASGPVDEVFENELLSDVFGTDIRVEWHDVLERLVVHA